MFSGWRRMVLFAAAFGLIAVSSAHAVKNARVSTYGGGHQIWFEAEDYDERNPDTEEYFVVADGAGAYGRVVTRVSAAAA
ncbi:MAG: hypothetical protein O3A46_03330 [Candidatus Poribacteria bacterium]|nr:hypothetical protein [Candidatus Poribacteria bacterium]